MTGKNGKPMKIKIHRNFHFTFFLVTLLYHVAPYIRERQPDDDEHSKISVFTGDKLVGLGILADYVVGSSLFTRRE